MGTSTTNSSRKGRKYQKEVAEVVESASKVAPLTLEDIKKREAAKTKPPREHNSGPIKPSRTRDLSKPIDPNATGQKKGRPSQLEDLDLEIMCDYARRGVPFRHIAASMGVSYRVFQQWLQAGEAEYAPLYIEFYQQITAARAEWVKERLDNIKVKSGEDWRADAWLLERQEPREFGNQTKITGDAETPFTVAITDGQTQEKASPEEQAANVARILAESGALDTPIAPKAVEDAADE